MNWGENWFFPYFVAGNSARDVPSMLFSRLLGLLRIKTTDYFMLSKVLAFLLAEIYYLCSQINVNLELDNMLL